MLSLAKIIITYIYIKKDLVYILSLLKCSILENIFLKYNLFSKRVYFFII
ncbi:putative secreted protein [Clostridioides difficile P7]|nr:putative secreted protein [Clostridioides difficile P7]